MLVDWWAILWMPLLHTFLIAKLMSLVYCLCKWHNFCIDQCEADAQDHMSDVHSNITRAQWQGILCLDKNILPLWDVVNGRQESAIPCNFHPSSRMAGWMVQASLQPVPPSVMTPPLFLSPAVFLLFHLSLSFLLPSIQLFSIRPLPRQLFFFMIQLSCCYCWSDCGGPSLGYLALPTFYFLLTMPKYT